MKKTRVLILNFINYTDSRTINENIEKIEETGGEVISIIPIERKTNLGNNVEVIITYSLKEESEEKILND